MIRGLVLLRVLKSKMASVRDMVAPFRVLSRKIGQELNASQLIWFPLRVKNCSDHAQKAKFWYLLAVLFKTSDDYPRHFYMGVPLPLKADYIFQLLKMSSYYLLPGKLREETIQICS